ncbi:TPA: phage/plasmid primase, P4 family [Enterococcus faecium]
MSELIELQNIQKENLERAKKNLPKWVYYNEKGALKVDAQQLAYEVIKEIPMIIAPDVSFGARFDKNIGAWRLDSLSDFLDVYITDKLEPVGMWNTRTLTVTKTFIFIRIRDVTLTENPFDLSDPCLANFKNGTYNIKTGEMKDHDTKDYILQSQEYAIDPQNNQKPEKTLSWLNDLTGDEKSVAYLMEMIGYCFYRSYEPFQCISILQGNGKNGKSTFLNLLTKMLGKRNVSNVTLQDLGNKQNRFSSSNLYQKLANVFADIDSEFIKSTGLLKTLTGGDRLAAERKMKDAFMFVNFAKLIFSANELPAFSDFTTGFERRLYVVPFDRVIDEAFKEKHDLKAIESEIPVFTVECMKMFNRALERKEMTVSDKMKQAKDKWLKESNHVARFLEEMCDIDMESNEGDSSKMIYEEYQNFCFRESIRELSQPRFTKQLETLGIYKKNPRINGQRMKRYIHLFLKKNIFNTNN